MQYNFNLTNFCTNNGSLINLDVSDTTEQKLNYLLLFWTAHPMLPVDPSKRLSVRFLDALSQKQLPEADTCPMVLYLPTIHREYDKFRKSMDKAVEYAKVGFGKM